MPKVVTAMSLVPAGKAALEIRVSAANRLPDKAPWTNRFEIRSSSSGRFYVIAQQMYKRHFGCSCPGWRIHRKCTHLIEIGLPCFEKPFEVNLVSE